MGDDISVAEDTDKDACSAPQKFSENQTSEISSPSYGSGPFTGHFQDQPAVGQVVSVLPVALPTVLIGKTIYLNEVKLPTKAKTLAIVL